jgi:hypothetical protein
METRRRQAILACALHRYRLDHDGRFPERLEALVPTYVEAVLRDPIDGAPMRYRLDDAKGIVLYSLGNDGSDDGGDATAVGSFAAETAAVSIYSRDWCWWPPRIASPATETPENAADAKP